MLLILLLLAVVFIVYSTTKLNLHPFLALLIAAILYGLCSGMSFETITQSINEGFGKTLGSIGLVIIIGVIIGTFLEKSGGAYTLAQSVLKLTGKKNVPIGMALMGYIVSIPVFCDSGFIILTPLNKALTKSIKKSLSITAIALGLGLLASHAMVPPTPGPIAVAGIVSADLGLVIFWGLIVSLLSLVPVIFFATRIAAKTYIDPNPELDEEAIQQKIQHAPRASLSFLPILVPILLIVLKSFNDYAEFITHTKVVDIISFLGTPVIALLIGLGFALLLPKKLEKQMLSTNGWVGKALKDAAIIIMITGAGGIFGKVLQNSGLAEMIGELLGGIHLGIWLPFLIAAALKTAQGSSTVAMITTASIIAPMMNDLGFDSEIAKALGVLAIGAGSTVVSHANDSFFWVVTQMSNMDVRTGYRLHSLGTAILGGSAILIIAVLWFILV
jgi:GntP family gluconate:H+ symporter